MATSLVVNTGPERRPTSVFEVWITCRLPCRRRLLLFGVRAQPAVQIGQGLVHSAHATMACTSRDHLFLSIKVGYQDFRCQH
jgi:hypothetical protein